MAKTRLVFLQEFLEAKNGTSFSEEEAIVWFREKTPFKSGSSIRLLLLNATTNVIRSRKRSWRYGERGYDLLFRLPGSKRYRKYDASTDPPPLTR